jgi:Flp pilus assembly pilin Flp
MRRLLRKLGQDPSAATAVEYAFMLALIAQGMLAGLTMLAGETTSLWGDVEAKATLAVEAARQSSG